MMKFEGQGTIFNGLELEFQNLRRLIDKLEETLPLLEIGRSWGYKWKLYMDYWRGNDAIPVEKVKRGRTKIFSPSIYAFKIL